MIESIVFCCWNHAWTCRTCDAARLFHVKIANDDQREMSPTGVKVNLVFHTRWVDWFLHDLHMHVHMLLDLAKRCDLKRA